MKILDVHKQTSLLDLIEQGAHKLALEQLKEDINFTKDELNNSLISACHHGYTFIVQLLVQLGADVNYRDTNGNTPLLVSVQNGMIDIAQFLLTNKADVNASNSMGDSALILSIRFKKSTQITEDLLKHREINIDHQNQDGYTAIMTAAEVKNVNALRILLDKYFNAHIISPTVPLYEPIDEHKTHEHTSHSVCEYASQWRTLQKTVNCNGETVHQIAKRCEIGSVFHLLQEHVITKISPLVIAMRASDVKSFHILLECDLLYAHKRKTTLDEVFLQIFKKCGDKGMHFNENDITMIKALLEHGADVNTTWIGDTPVFDKFSSRPVSWLYGNRRIDPVLFSAKSGCVQVLELLLSFKANVNKYDFPNSPLNIALSYGHIECAKLLIQHGANIFFNLALQLAVDQQEPKYMRFLIESYKNKMIKHLKTSKIQRILLKSVRNDNLEIIGLILDLGANINGVMGFEICPLAESKNGKVAKFLIDRGANVNHVKCIREESSYSPLLKVLDNRDSTDNYVIEVIQVLLENGASANDRYWIGLTALMLAAMKEGSMSVLQLFLSHGAEFSERDREGNTALIHAARCGCFQNVSFLLEFIKDKKEILNLQNNEGLTALAYLMRFRNAAIIKELLDQGADISIKDRHGNSFLLLHLIISEKHEDKILKNLIQAGCDVNSQNNDGLSPLMVSAQKYLKDAMCVLLDSGAVINAVSKNDHTKTALTHLLYTLPLHDDYFSCLEYLLDRGASASYLEANALQRMIVSDKINIVPKLIRCGLRPFSILTTCLQLVHQENLANIFKLVLCEAAGTSFHCSPLCTALCVGNSTLARFFVDNLFLTHSDVSVLGHNIWLRRHLEKLQYKECLNILNEISTKPMTLFNLSFVAVSTAVGATPGHEIRVNKLHIPQIIKEKLLFKKMDVPLILPETNVATRIFSLIALGCLTYIL